MCPECGGEGIAVDEDSEYDDGKFVGNIYEINCLTPGCNGVWVEGDE